MKVKQLTEERVREIVKEEVRANNDDFEARLTEKLVRLIKDPLMDVLDSFLKEIKDSRDEQTLLAGRQSIHSDEIEALDIRVTKIEKHIHFAT